MADSNRPPAHTLKRFQWACTSPGDLIFGRLRCEQGGGFQLAQAHKRCGSKNVAVERYHLSILARNNSRPARSSKDAFAIRLAG